MYLMWVLCRGTSLLLSDSTVNKVMIWCCIMINKWRSWLYDNTVTWWPLLCIITIIHHHTSLSFIIIHHNHHHTSLSFIIIIHHNHYHSSSYIIITMFLYLGILRLLMGNDSSDDMDEMRMMQMQVCHVDNNMYICIDCYM